MEFLLEIAKEFGVPVAVAAGSVAFVYVLLKFIKKIFEEQQEERKNIQKQYIEHIEENNEKLQELLLENQIIIKENQQTTSKLADIIKNNSDIMLKFTNKLDIFDFAIIKK